MKIKKKMTAGKIVLDGGSHHLDRNVLEHVQRKRQEQENSICSKQMKDDLGYLKMCYEADKVKETYGDIAVEKWRRKDKIVAYIKPLKCNGNGAMSSLRRDVEKQCYEWKD